MIKESKTMTKKDLIVDFVALHEKKGARYVDIIKFIFEHNNPCCTYTNENRGYYSSAFSSFTNYLLKGENCLEKIGNRYYAKRQGVTWHVPCFLTPKK